MNHSIVLLLWYCCVTACVLQEFCDLFEESGLLDDKSPQREVSTAFIRAKQTVRFIL
jgi:hypothetical protein